MSGALPAVLAGAFRRAAVPLAAYYIVTIALPVANGAASSGNGFVKHLFAVLIMPAFVILVACGGRWVNARFCRVTGEK